MSDSDEERLERLWQEKEAAWAAVEKELWWLLSLPRELWRPHDRRLPPLPDEPFRRPDGSRKSN